MNSNSFSGLRFIRSINRCHYVHKIIQLEIELVVLLDTRTRIVVKSAIIIYFSRNANTFLVPFNDIDTWNWIWKMSFVNVTSYNAIQIRIDVFWKSNSYFDVYFIYFSAI